MGLTVPVQAALLGRLPVTPGGTDYQAYYDTDLNSTWTADAGMIELTQWDHAVNWATTLTIGGVTGWRLPTRQWVVLVECLKNQMME